MPGKSLEGSPEKDKVLQVVRLKLHCPKCKQTDGVKVLQVPVAKDRADHPNWNNDVIGILNCPGCGDMLLALSSEIQNLV